MHAEHPAHCWLALVILALSATGCLAGADRTRHRIEHDGRQRTYVLHQPESERPANGWPVVIALHPFAGTGPGMARTTRFDEIADREGFLTCYPQGITFLWNGDPTDEGKGVLVEDGDDVGYISALIDELIERWDADPARIYITGASNGGLMAQRVACELGERIAAMATVMITMPEGFPAWCTMPTRTPTLIMFGTEDPFFPGEGGPVQQGPGQSAPYLSARDTVNFWVQHNGAATTPEVQALPDQAPEDGTRVTLERYPGGAEGKEVRFYRVEGGGHTWPGSRPGFLERFAGVGTVSRDINASEVIWDFFKSQSNQRIAHP